MLWELGSVFTAVSYTHLDVYKRQTYTLFKGPGKEFLEYEKKMFQNSEIRTDATASEANVKDKIVTLSTCTGNQATRFVVQGKRVNAVNPQ